MLGWVLLVACGVTITARKRCSCGASAAFRSLAPVAYRLRSAAHLHAACAPRHARSRPLSAPLHFATLRATLAVIGRAAESPRYAAKGRLLPPLSLRSFSSSTVPPQPIGCSLVTGLGSPPPPAASLALALGFVALRSLGRAIKKPGRTLPCRRRPVVPCGD